MTSRLGIVAMDPSQPPLIDSELAPSQSTPSALAACPPPTSAVAAAVHDLSFAAVKRKQQGNVLVQDVGSVAGAQVAGRPEGAAFATPEPSRKKPAARKPRPSVHNTMAYPTPATPTPKAVAPPPNCVYAHQVFEEMPISMQLLDLPDGCANAM
jgi:hypothetical protein